MQNSRRCAFHDGPKMDTPSLHARVAVYLSASRAIWPHVFLSPYSSGCAGRAGGRGGADSAAPSDWL